MYLIVGLGNPEPEYARTRHNMGFDVVNKLAISQNITLTKHQFKGIYGTGDMQGKKVILLKPQTYMNLSGNCVRRFVDFYKIEPQNLIVVYDDMDIPKSQIRIRKKGESGSHNGMKSIVEELGTTDFPRVRVGIGKPEFGKDRINFVIGKLKTEEYSSLVEGIDNAKEAIISMIIDGYDIAMNKYNEKKKGESSEGNSNN